MSTLQGPTNSRRRCGTAVSYDLWIFIGDKKTEINAVLDHQKCPFDIFKMVVLGAGPSPYYISL